MRPGSLQKHNPISSATMYLIMCPPELAPCNLGGDQAGKLAMVHILKPCADFSKVLLVKMQRINVPRHPLGSTWCPESWEWVSRPGKDLGEKANAFLRKFIHNWGWDWELGKGGKWHQTPPQVWAVSSTLHLEQIVLKNSAHGQGMD